MKQSFLIFLLMNFLSVCFAFCKDNTHVSGNSKVQNINNKKDTMSNKIKIRIGSNTFTATLLDNPTATAFKALLPLTINMKELNGNEKYAELPKNLVTNSSNPGTIKTGDIMLYGSNTLVLFYRTFSTSYSYTKLGHLNNVDGLTEAVGLGNVTVTFEAE